MLLSPSTGSFNTGQTFTATIQAAPNGDSINAVEASLSFDPALLSVVSVSKNGSVFSLWTTEPEFSNSAGTISFGGGSPTPFTSTSNLLVVTFRAVAPGSPSVAFDSASALAADGRGTDVLDASPSANYTIAAAAEQPAVPEAQTDDTPTEPEEGSDAAIAFGDPPRAPEVGSQAFLDPELWYSETDGLFTWELPFDVNAVAVDLATSSDHDPEEVYDPPIEEFVVSANNLVEGIQYLSVQFENQVGWGGITNRIIKIDTQPPEPFEIQIQTSNSKNGFPLLVFEADDTTSGIAKYEMIIAGGEPIEVTPDEAKLGYLLGELEDGTYTVKVTAFDMAGNERVSTAPVLITAGWIKPSETEETSSFWSFFTGSNILIIVLILLVIAEFLYILQQRRVFSKREEKLRKETREIQDQMEKIFSALRDEIYDQINTITKRPRLSKKEKEAVEGLNQALEVSETLIEKEVNDVKKILK
ncbi:cohesin domain-containing protein [Candidatus Pacebacteria bacterium]|nr:cohesin domain-containing protein [Candidatus Paceibacterota bacterium]